MEAALNTPGGKRATATFPWRPKGGLSCECLNSKGAEIRLHSPGLRKQWIEGRLRTRWFTAYPMLFDERDLSNALSQPRRHFREWAAAVHFYRYHGGEHRRDRRTQRGYRALIEKYGYAKRHSWKYAIALLLVGPKRIKLLSDRARGQPDLLLYRPETRDFLFVEVKGPREGTLKSQQAMHARFALQFRKAVRLVRIMDEG